MTTDHQIFDVNETENRIDFVFASTFANIDKVCDMTVQYLQTREISLKKQIFAINLVIREGLTNAVRHGNKSDPEKLVRFNVEIIDHKSIHLKIEDEGQGFHWQDVQDSEMPEDEEHGRGIIIMGQYFSNFTYNDKGNILFLEKEI